MLGVCVFVVSRFWMGVCGCWCSLVHSLPLLGVVAVAVVAKHGDGSLLALVWNLVIRCKGRYVMMLE